MNTPKSTPQKMKGKCKQSNLVESLLKVPVYQIDTQKVNERNISPYDRLQALIRIPQIKNAFDAIKKENNPKKKSRLENDFYKNYGLSPHLIELLINKPQDESGKLKDIHNAIHSHEAVDIIRIDHIKNLLQPIRMPALKNQGQTSLLGSPGALPNYWELPLDYNRVCSVLDKAIPSNGKHLMLCIDLSKNKGVIMAEVEKHIANAIKEGRKRQKRNIEFQYSPWDIYDRCSRYKTKPNYTAIARELSGKPGQARDNEQLSACLKAVKRSHKEAIKIIKQVEKAV